MIIRSRVVKEVERLYHMLVNTDIVGTTPKCGLYVYARIFILLKGGTFQHVLFAESKKNRYDTSKLYL